MTLRTHLDGRIFAEHVTGRSPPVLALHGWRRDRTDLLPALRGRDVVAVDLPGFGASPVPPEAWGARAYADAIAELAREISEGPFLVVGHSFGGRIAAHLAADHPDVVSGVVFAGVPLLKRTTKSRSPVAYRLARSARRLRLLPERYLDSMRRRYGSDDYNAATGTMRAVLVRAVNEDYRAQLVQTTCPVGFCWGALDTAAPPAVAREAAGIMSHVVSVEIVENAGHDVHRVAPERLSEVVDAVAKAVG